MPIRNMRNMNMIMSAKLTSYFVGTIPSRGQYPNGAFMGTFSLDRHPFPG